MTRLFISFFLLLFLSPSLKAQHNYKEITLTQLMKKVQDGEKNMIILDVRSTGEYMDTVPGGRQIGIGRIRNAINIPIRDLQQKPGTLKLLDQHKDKEIYVICSHSYRSRSVSNLLLENGFKGVNNVQGGMTEWYRDYDGLKLYAAAFLENNIPYRNLAPAQLFKMLQAKEPVEIIGFTNPPRFFFDSLVAPLYAVFPDFKKVSYYRPADSLQVLEKVKATNGKPVVFFSTVGGGASETAHWLSQKGYNNVYHLTTNLAGFFEYMANYQPKAMPAYLISRTRVRYFTPLSFCNNQPANVQWVDMRHDTTFNKITRGTKLEYRTLKGAVNFPLYKPVEEFVKQFPDKKKIYMIIPDRGYAGVDFAEALIRQGYQVGWLLGGIERWEWYTNNLPEFKCGDQLLK